MCKAKVYNRITKFRTGIASLHDIDNLGQTCKAHNAPEVEKSGQRVFLLLEIRCWFIGGANALQSKKNKGFIGRTCINGVFAAGVA